jgi:hypothetical protein
MGGGIVFAEESLGTSNAGACIGQMLVCAISASDGALGALRALETRTARNDLIFCRAVVALRTVHSEDSESSLLTELSTGASETVSHDSLGLEIIVGARFTGCGA